VCRSGPCVGNVLLATIGYRGQLASPVSPAFDLHHPDAAPSEHDTNEADDDKLIDARGKATVAWQNFKPVSQVNPQLQ
jgi:hypothetical protein